MTLVFFLITLFMIAVIVYILIGRKDRAEKNNASYMASAEPWLDDLIDKLTS